MAYTPALASSSGTFRVEGPWISIIDPGGIPTIGYGPAAYAVKYDSAGIAQAGELPVNLGYILYLAGIAQTSGVTWTYKVTSGTVNGFTSASGVKSMSGTGSGTFTLSSLGGDVDSIEITGATAASSAKLVVAFTKQYASPTTSGASGGDTPAQTSGFGSFNSSTFTVVTNTLTFTTPAATTTLTATVNLSAKPGTGVDGTWTVEGKIQRLIGATWTDQGATFSDTSDVTTDPDSGGLQIRSAANIAGTRQSTGLTAGVQYSYRAVLRITSGTRTHTVTGSMSIASP